MSTSSKMMFGKAAASSFSSPSWPLFAVQELPEHLGDFEIVVDHENGCHSATMRSLLGRVKLDSKLMADLALLPENVSLGYCGTDWTPVHGV